MSERPDGVEQGDDEGVQSGSGDVLGVHVLCEDLSGAGDGGEGLCGLCAAGCVCDAVAEFGQHHVDGEVPQWNDKEVQVPDPHYPGGFGGTGRRVSDRYGRFIEPVTVHGAGVDEVR